MHKAMHKIPAMSSQEDAELARRLQDVRVSFVYGRARGHRPLVFRNLTPSLFAIKQEEFNAAGGAAAQPEAALPAQPAKAFPVHTQALGVTYLCLIDAVSAAFPC